MTTGHWDDVYTTRAEDEVSWFQSEPAASLARIEQVTAPGSRIVDVGGGASRLVDRLVARGDEVTVVDLSQAALDVVMGRLGSVSDEPMGRLGSVSGRARLVVADILDWEPDGLYDVWHDRAALHFLTEASQRERYAALAIRAVKPGGHAVIASFAPDGPTHCSGLEVQRADADALADLLAAGFDLVDSSTEDHVTPAGAVQRFTWAVLRRRAEG